MAKIPNSTALSQDTPSPGPQANLVDRASAIAFAAPGQALQEMGGAVSRIGADFAANAMEAQNHDVEKRMLDYQLAGDRAQQQARENMSPDGSGHTDSVLNGIDDAGRQIFAGLTPYQQRRADLKVEQYRKNAQIQAMHAEDQQRYGYARNDVDQRTAALAERVAAGNTTLEEARAQAEAIVSSSPLRQQDKWDRLDKRGPKNVRQMIEDTFVRGEMEKLDSGLKAGTLSQDEWVKAHQELRDRLLRRQPGDVDDEINAPGAPGGGQGGGQPGGRPFPVPGMNPSQVPRSGGSTNSREHMGPRGGGSHAGWDIPLEVGKPVVAVGNGTVIAKGSGQGYGEYVDVRYEDGTIHRLAHLGDESKGGRQKAFAEGIQVGSKVAPGQELGYGGFSGNAGREFTHVHYEIFPDKSAYDKAAGGSSRATAGLRINPRDYFSRGQDVDSGGRAGGEAIAPKLTAYSPQAGGSKMEGGYAASKAGPDGEAQVRTLEDLQSGRSKYITVAGDPSQYGKSYTIPRIEWIDSKGQKQVSENVTAVVHDTGSAFKGAGSRRFDIPVAKDLTNAQMNAQPFLKGGVQFVEQRSALGGPVEKAAPPPVSERGVTQAAGLEKPHTVSFAGLSDLDKGARLTDLITRGYTSFVHKSGSDGDVISAWKTRGYGWRATGSSQAKDLNGGGDLDDPKFAGPAWAEDAIAKLREARGQEGDRKPDPNSPMPAADGRVQVAQAKTGTATDAGPQRQDRRLVVDVNEPNAANGQPPPSVFGVHADAIEAAAKTNPDRTLREVIRDADPEGDPDGKNYQALMSSLEHKYRGFNSVPDFDELTVGQAMKLASEAGREDVDRSAAEKSGKSIVLFDLSPLERKELGGAIRDPAKTLGDVLSAARVEQIAREHPELNADTPVRDAVSVLGGTGATADERQFYFDKDAPFRHLTGQQRRKLVNVIEDRLNKGMGEMRVQTQNDFKNHIDNLKAVGEGKDINWRTYEGMFSVRQVAQMKLMDEQARIQGTFATGLKEAATMPEAELRQRIEAMAPTEDDKHAAFKTGLQRKAQVQFVKLMNERRVDPARAVASDQAVQQAQEEATALSSSQSPPQGYRAKLVEARYEAQRLAGIPTIAQKPITNQEAAQLGQYIVRVDPRQGREAMQGLMTMIRRDYSDRHAVAVFDAVIASGMRGSSTEERDLARSIMQRTIRNEQIPARDWYKFSDLRRIDNETFTPDTTNGGRPDTPLARQPQAPQPGGAASPAQRTDVPQMSPRQAAVIEKYRDRLTTDPAYRAQAEQRMGLNPGDLDRYLKSKR